MRKNARFFLGTGLLALALRLLFVLRFPGIVDDSRLYADIATNWLRHGIYGITDSGQIVPTLSRLPGYPGFLALIFAIFGSNNFRAVLLIQVLVDLGSCFLIADIARRMFSDRAAKAAFQFAALCPFLANYAAAALTETVEISFTTLALRFAVLGLEDLARDSTSRSAWGNWLGCGLSSGACILLRPDGGILLAAIGAYLCFFKLYFHILRPIVTGRGWVYDARPILRAGLILACSALAPLVPWTIRNLHTMHRFQPIAPRYANDADELIMRGFNRWSKTWIAEYTSVQEIYWRMPGDAVDIARLPQRAFDSSDQQEETKQLFAEYNQDHDLTPELDARFAALAEQRIRSAPLRYYLWLPALRIADMWLRPRTELLPPDPRWWEFDDDGFWLSVSIVFGLLNLAYMGLAATGAWQTRAVPSVGLFVLFVAIRSIFLGTLENPEPRYTLECYPLVIILAASSISTKLISTKKRIAKLHDNNHNLSSHTSTI